MTRHLVLLAALVSWLSACSPPATQPRPLPGGLPPEYEPPRAFDMPGGSAQSPGNPPAEGPAAPAPTGASPSTPGND